MSAHVEWLAASARGVAARTPVGEHDTEQPAVVIGGADNMAVVQGDPDTLREFAKAVEQAVERAILTPEQRINEAVVKAEQAFWRVVADEFPTAKTGDFPPDATFAWEDAARLAIERWTGWNVPEFMDTEQPTDAELAAQHDTYVLDALDVDETVVAQARDLRSEHGENPEYDRALVELTMRVLGRTEDDRDDIERAVLGGRTVQD